MTGKDTGLELLKVWRSAMDFAVIVYREVIPVLPSEEKYALDHQFRRSVQSIPANIAEGYGCYYCQDNVRFCYIAHGSLEETISHLTLTNKLGNLSEDILGSTMQLSDELHRMLYGYIGFLKRSKRGENEPGSHNIQEESAIYSMLESSEYTDDPSSNHLIPSDPVLDYPITCHPVTIFSIKE